MQAAAPWREVGSRPAVPGGRRSGVLSGGGQGPVAGAHRACGLASSAPIAGPWAGRCGFGAEPITRALIAVATGERADSDSGPSLGLAPGAGPPHLLVPPVWQHPFLNVFRQFKVDEWKRSTKEGDVATVMVSEPEDLAAGGGLRFSAWDSGGQRLSGAP